MLALDTQTFRLINNLLGDPTLDFIMSLVSDTTLWVVIFAILLVTALVLKRFAIAKRLVMIYLAMGITDQVSFEVVKQIVKRERPCWELENVKTLNGKCGGSYGFTSNHAANAGTAAYLVWKVFGHKIGVVAWLIAGMVGFSRIYLGVHYPLDVVGGFILGMLVGKLIFPYMRGHN